MTGTSSRASVSDTKVWQLAVLPSAEAYCAATPTECVPFLGIAVSSITSTASSPPTSLSAWISSSVSTGVASQTPAAMRWVQLVAFAQRKPLRHRLNTLAIARTDQPRHVERAHLSPCLVTQPIQKRLEPTAELASPIRRSANHGRPLQKADHP